MVPDVLAIRQFPDGVPEVSVGYCARNVSNEIPGTPNNHLKMDGNGETTISYVKIGNHPIETTIYKLLFGVPGTQPPILPWFLRRGRPRANSAFGVKWCHWSGATLQAWRTRWRLKMMVRMRSLPYFNLMFPSFCFIFPGSTSRSFRYFLGFPD